MQPPASTVATTISAAGSAALHLRLSSLMVVLRTRAFWLRAVCQQPRPLDSADITVRTSQFGDATGGRTSHHVRRSVLCLDHRHYEISSVTTGEEQALTLQTILRAVEARWLEELARTRR